MRSMSPVQEAIWLTQSIYPNSPLYNVGGYARIDGALSVSRLMTSIKDVLEAADVIFVDDHAAFELSFIDLSGTPLPDEHCIGWMREDMDKIIDLQGNVMKVTVLKALDQRHYWYVKVHHLFFDGYSMA